MANIVQSVDDRSYRARADRSIQSGRVVAMDATAGEAILDVGMINADGVPVYMHGAPFSPQTPPQINDTVPIHRTNSSPYSFTLGSGAQVGGGNSGQVVQNGGVSSLAKSGSTKLKNDVTLTPGANITITESGQDLLIAAAASSLTPASTVTDVAAADAVGTSLNYAREDHAHKGVHTVAKSGSAGLAGDVTLTGTGGVSLTQSGQNIAIDGSAAGPSAGTTAQDVGSADAGGSASTYSKSDHVHKGVHSVAKSGGTALFGDVTLSGTGGIAINPSGNNLAIDGSGISGGGISGLAAQHNGVAVATEPTFNFKDGTYFTWDLIDHAGTTTLDVNIVDANVSAFTGDLFVLGGAYHAPVGLKYVYIDNGTNSPAGVTMPTLKTGGPTAHEVTVTNDNSGAFTLTAAATETIEQVGGTYANTFSMPVGSRHVFVGIGGTSSDGIWRKVV